MTSTKPARFTDTQRSAILNALQVAADIYIRDAVTARTTGDGRLEQTFTKQALDVLTLADSIECADYIELGPEVE